jgi:hypothetical protein
MAPEYRFSHTFLQIIVNFQEKVGPLKVWELLTESGREDGNGKNGGQHLSYLLVDELLLLVWLTTNRFCRFSVRRVVVGKLSNGFQVRITLP